MPAQVDKPVLPPVLYRYRGLREDDQDCLAREIDAIRNQTLYCSRYKALNDPMEGFFEPSLRFQQDTAFSKAARRMVFDAKQDIGICCFSDTYDNELMWTHYARNYTGICVGYRTKELIEGLSDRVHLVRVAYDSTPPKLGKSDWNAYLMAIKILSHKKANWIYEREWRLLADIGPLRIESARCIVELRLGSRLSPQHRELLLEAFRDSGIKISTMTVNDYTHRWRNERPRPRRRAAA